MNDFSYFLCAHRGASGNFPENTRLAFKKAKESGVKWIETDLNMLADGVFIIFHDDRL
ncbi:MAG: glycerophosphodiester phosphodiesterase family protein, partial [Proteobacteria bacterium]|nr:glycerophosphodiester phosphodiesterase family protein [Pseudomonadota bacterium]